MPIGEGKGEDVEIMGCKVHICLLSRIMAILNADLDVIANLRKTDYFKDFLFIADQNSLKVVKIE